jgi:hypothetical protein
MNTKTLKAITLAVSILAGIGATTPAMATSTGAQALGVAQNSVDVWTFTCPVLFPRGRVTVQDTVATFSLLNRIQVVLGKTGFVSSQVQDNSGGILLGEGGATSAAAVVNGTPGLYAATFKKTLNGVESYIGDLYCTNVFGFRSNPAITRQINQ